VGVRGDVDDAGALEVAVDVVAVDGVLDGVEVLQAELPLAMPWVRLDSMNPPLRPLAADPISAASISTTSRDGSRSLAMIAVHSPV
jgi:hypothetical protein